MQVKGRSDFDQLCWKKNSPRFPIFQGNHFSSETKSFFQKRAQNLVQTVSVRSIISELSDLPDSQTGQAMAVTFTVTIKEQRYVGHKTAQIREGLGGRERAKHK